MLYAKWAIVIAGVLIVLFDAGFFFLTRPYLYFGSVLLGLASACEYA